ncbi:MAG: FGGY family carbohydrate kinase [Chitinophagia bacterium]|jgi:sugar (pentulose or hexulose) kinase
MTVQEVLVIFDIGKTNKKLLLFNSEYEVVLEDSIQISELNDEDGFPCEDIDALTDWILLSYHSIQNNYQYKIKAVHYCAYGASWVFLNKEGKKIGKLYNYLKPLLSETQALFEKKYGPIEQICLQTASPNLDNLNSGLQLFRLKTEQPDFFAQIKWALHLPQYVHYLITGEIASDITSIGCHTLLWNFEKQCYHSWVKEEGLENVFPPILTNVGLHDSSAALIPYSRCSPEKFMLISTGTWCISLHPSNADPLTLAELKQDVLCYLTPYGEPVKASRVFLGKKYEELLQELNNQLLDSSEYEVAYQQLMENIVTEQVKSSQIILQQNKVSRIYVDGGFSNNKLFMQLLAKAFPEQAVYAASVPQAGAIGAALQVSADWNNQYERRFEKNLIRY